MLDAKNTETDSGVRVYELGFLVSPLIEAERLPAVFGDLRELILSSGGYVISDEMPRPVNLAYTMEKVISNVRRKFSTAYFGWVKFNMSREKVLQLKKSLDLNLDFIRFLIFKTVKENTFVPKRYTRHDMPGERIPAVAKSVEAPVPINKEEVDKEIEKMVSN